VFDFPIVSIATSLTFDGSIIIDARVVFGSVAPTPFRDYDVENVLKGKELGDNLQDKAAAAVMRDATPLGNNRYKIEIAKGLVRKAITTLSTRKNIRDKKE
jgi:xanthine dehydrogenase YagS FAD-binding subunit